MFNNLIESSSHRSEFRRRGSFFLFTTASYALFFVIAGVVSIYAYDARMEDQSLELVTMMPLVDLPAPASPPAVTPHNPSAPKGSSSKKAYFERIAAIAAVDNPQVTPDKISTTPNPGLPMPKSGPVVFNGHDSDPGELGSLGSARGTTDDGASSNPVIAISEPPAPEPIPKPAAKVIRKRVLNGDALSLPKPPYPAIAKQMHVQGTVNVQVLIDEMGKVISAKAVSGNPLLTYGAQTAAYQARFSPTFLGDQPVKVSGVITYNFVLQ